MIKVCINTYGDCGHVEYCVEMETTADWARTPQETAVGLLFEGVEQVSRALQVDRPSAGEQPTADEVSVQRGSILCREGDHLTCENSPRLVCSCPCHVESE